MARLSNGFLGNASGKIGNVVFARWRNIFTARQYQPDIEDAKTPAQLKQRSRMVALLQFLKPLNKSFIKRFNASLDKNSTPWAVAIKANMKAVSPDACMHLEDLSLGAPSVPAVKMLSAAYNPFINQMLLTYTSGQNYPIPKSMPLVLASVLGKYKSQGDSHAFDTRNLITEQPAGSFFSPFSDGFKYDNYDNFWDVGLLWLSLFEAEKAAAPMNLNDNLAAPVSFSPEPLIEYFNNDYSEDLIPIEAISWEFSDMPGEDVLVFTIDLEKTLITDPEDAAIGMVLVSLNTEKVEYIKPDAWQLVDASFTVTVGDTKALGSFIVLYGVVNKDLEQISRFNRFYVNKNIDGLELPLFQQLFDTGYTHPLSFILPGNTCGFCGSLDELFYDFVSFWERLYHKDDPPPEPPTVYKLSLTLVGPGDVIVEGCEYIDESFYYFNDGESAQLTIQPDDEAHFLKWQGPDAVDVTLKETGVYYLLMSKDRDITAAFELDVPEV